MAPTDLRQTLAQSLVVGLPGPTVGRRERRLVAEEGIGGVILFDRNLPAPTDPRQVWRLNRDLRQAAAAAGRPPLLVMVDQEGGSVTRLGEPFTHGPDLARVGDSWGETGAHAHGARLGAELVLAGFNWNLAPVVDVHAVAGGVMARRSLGPDPWQVAKLAAAYITGQRATGCLSCAKHFPGLGRTVADTHRRRPRVALSLEQLREVELVPFRAAIASGVEGVMVCHAVFEAIDPQRPASLSSAVIELLRREMGFDGLVLSDDLEMGALAAEMQPDQAVVEAYRAGCDLLLVCHRPEMAIAGLDRLVALAESGEIPAERIAAGAERIAACKRRLQAMPPAWSHLASLLDLPVQPAV